MCCHVVLANIFQGMLSQEVKSPQHDMKRQSEGILPTTSPSLASEKLPN